MVVTERGAFGASALAKYDAESKSVAENALDQMEKVMYKEGSAPETSVAPAQRDAPAIFKAGSPEFAQEAEDWSKDFDHLRVRGAAVVGTILEDTETGSNSFGKPDEEEVFAIDRSGEETKSRDSERLAITRTSDEQGFSESLSRGASREKLVKQMFDAVWKDAAIPLGRAADAMSRNIMNGNRNGSAGGSRSGKRPTSSGRSSGELRASLAASPSSAEIRGTSSEASYPSSRSSVSASPMKHGSSVLKSIPIARGTDAFNSGHSSPVIHFSGMVQDQVHALWLNQPPILASSWDRQIPRKQSASRTLERENSVGSMGGSSGSTAKSSLPSIPATSNLTKLPSLGSTNQPQPQPQRLKTAALGHLSSSNVSFDASTPQHRLSTAPGKGSVPASGGSSRVPKGTSSSSASTISHGTQQRPSTRGNENGQSTRQYKSSLTSASNIYGGVGGASSSGSLDINGHRKQPQNGLKDTRPKTRGSELHAPGMAGSINSKQFSSTYHYQQQQQQQQTRKQMTNSSSYNKAPSQQQPQQQLQQQILRDMAAKAASVAKPKTSVTSPVAKPEDTSVAGMSLDDYLRGSATVMPAMAETGMSVSDFTSESERFQRPATRGTTRPPTRGNADEISGGEMLTGPGSVIVQGSLRPMTRGAGVTGVETEQYGRPATRGESRQAAVGESFGRPGTRGGNTRITKTSGDVGMGDMGMRPKTRGPPELTKFTEWGFDIIEDDVALFNDGQKVGKGRASRQPKQ